MCSNMISQNYMASSFETHHRLKKAIVFGQRASSHKQTKSMRPPRSLSVLRRASDRTLSRLLMDTYRHTSASSTLSSPKTPLMSCQCLSRGIMQSNLSQMQHRRPGLDPYFQVRGPSLSGPDLRVKPGSDLVWTSK